MRIAIVAVLCVACGGGPKKDTDPDPGLQPPPQQQTEIEKRQDAACRAVGAKLKQCALDDDARMTPAEREKSDAAHTAPILEREYIKACTERYLSSRQIRVREVCLREETECAPFLSCLDNANPEK